jgi:hypothetical protein
MGLLKFLWTKWDNYGVDSYSSKSDMVFGASLLLIRNSGTYGENKVEEIELTDDDNADDLHANRLLGRLTRIFHLCLTC